MTHVLSNDRAFRESVLEGDTIKVIAERHGLAPSSVHKRIERGGREFVDQLHLDLLASHGTGELPALALPAQPGPTFNRALDFCRWLTNELEQRGIQIRLHYRPTPDGGLAIAFSDRNAPANSRAKVPADTTEER